MVLRAAVVVGGLVVAASGATLLIFDRMFWPIGVECCIGGLLITITVFIERRYVSHVDRGTEEWCDTGERFVDPTTSRVVQVRYDARTGARDYVGVDEGAEERLRS